jgi:hypothetical protein
VIGLALAVLAGYIMLGFAGGDPDRYGRVPVPGLGMVALPGDESEVYFVQGEGSTATAVPEDLLILIRDPGEGLLEIDPRGEEPDVRDGESVRLIGSINPPGEGRYEVRIASEDLAGRVSPQVSFGQSPSGAIGGRLEAVIDAALGPVGIALLALVVAIWFVPRLKLALTRARD